MTQAPTPPADSERALALLLAGGRIAIGAGLWFAPRFTLRALGFTKQDDPAIAVARIAGTRDLVLGAWQASVVSDRERLALPHPRAHERGFVLVPWLDADPDAVLRVDGDVVVVADLVAALDSSDVRRRPDTDPEGA